MMKSLNSIFSVAIFCLTCTPTFATDLMESWRAAQDHDPEFAAAQANFEAMMTHREQSRGIWLPTVGLTVGAGIQSATSETIGAQFSAPGFSQSTGVSFNTSIRRGEMTQYALVARQPLLNRTLLTQSRQLGLSADMAEIEWRSARQQLALRVAERYFDVLIASETLRQLLQQQTAIEFTLNEARDRFKFGSIPVTDTYEASARAETVRAQVMAADMDLQLKQSMFADLTGISGEHLLPLNVPTDQLKVNLPSIDACIRDASLNNPELLAQDKKLAGAKEDAEKHRALNSPSLDLIAQIGRDRLNGNGDYGSADNSASNRMIGIQLTIPLYTGGIRSAKYSEAVHLIDKAKFDGELLKQKIVVQVRATWLGVTVGENRLAALNQAYKASLARLEATRLGHSVGDRTTLDLLNAENDSTSAALAVLQANVNVRLNKLKLAQLIGNLDEAVLSDTNALLANTEN